MPVEYEIQTLKSDKWMINHYRDERDEAVRMADEIFADEQDLQGVMITAVHHNEGTGEVSERIIYKKLRKADGEENRESIAQALKKKRQEKESLDQDAALARRKKMKPGAKKTVNVAKDSPFKALVWMTFCAIILLGILYFAAHYLAGEGYFEIPSLPF